MTLKLDCKVINFFRTLQIFFLIFLKFFFAAILKNVFF